MENRERQIVLVIDDSILICQQVKIALSRENVFVCEAHSACKAMKLVSQYQPDLILLDVVLPDMNGYDLFHKLREIDQNSASILFLTSKDTGDDIVKGFSMGACDYIKKPFIQAELRSRVLTHLSLKEQKDNLNRQNEELRSSMEKLNYMAFRDGLTGLFNRRYVVGDLLEDIKYEEETEQKKNVMILADIDDFKLVNDTYGHDAGDMTLVCVAHILEGIGHTHKVVRWGGEEFLVVLFHVTEAEAFEISEKTRKEIADFQIVHESGEFSCTITLGLHVYNEEEGIEENINCADRALYWGKRNGKNCSIWYDKIMDGE